MNIIGRIRNFITTCWVVILSIIFVAIFIFNGWIKNYNATWWLGILSISVAIIFILIVITCLAYKTSLRIASKRFLKCDSTFCITVFLENSIEIVIGQVGQLLLLFLLYLGSEIVEISHEVFVIYSLVFFALWATPILKGLLTNLDVTYIKAFCGKLARRIQYMKKHYIIIGYGRFGKTVINDLFENYVNHEPKFENIYPERWFKLWDIIKPKSELKLEELEKNNEVAKPFLLLEKMLNDKYEDALVCTNLVIVEKEEGQLSNVFPHPNFGKIGVVVLDRLNCLRYNKENYKKKVYIPAIVGDAKNKSTLEFARIDRSKMVVSLMPDEEATLLLFNVINQKQEERKGIIAGTTTAQERLLIPQSYNTNVSFLHGHRIRGWELGGIVAANLISRRNKIEDVKILILGSGRQLHFLLEKIWLEILCEKKEIDKDFLTDNCLIIGNDEYINNTNITIGGHTYWNHELAYVTNSAVYKRGDYKMLVPYLRGISDEPTLLDPIISGAVPFYQEPFNRINPKFFDKRPEIIIISSDSHEEILKVFNEVDSMARKICPLSKPVIIAESNPDVRKVVMELNKRYNANNNSTKYPISLLNKPDPIEFSENVVNTFLNGDKMVRGYMEAMTREKGAVFRACVEDIPGVFVKLCFLLANLKIDNPNISGVSHVPSFHNIQALTQRNDYFCFFSDADLTSIEKEREKIVKFEFDMANHIREVFVSSDKPENKEWLIKGKDNPRVTPLIPIKTNENIRGSCMGLTFCPVCSFHESVEAESNHLITSDKEKARWKNNRDPEYKLNIVEENKRYEKFARIYACCKGGDASGALALLLYKFMLFGGDRFNIDFKERQDKQSVFNVKYIMNVECYNPRFELLEIYGNLVSCDGNKNKLQKLYSECLQGIVISPVTSANEWWDYSKKLRDKLKKESENKLTNPLLYHDCKEDENPDEKPPNNILLITEEYRNILLKEYVQFQIEKNVEELNIEGVIDEPSTEEWKLKLYHEFKSKKMKDTVTSNIESFTTKTLSEEVKAYLNPPTTSEKSDAWTKWINIHFDKDSESKDSKSSDQRHSCLCPITKCPFKSKALYLLINGTPL